MKACISVSIDGSASEGLSMRIRNSPAMISSVRDESARSFLRYARSRADKIRGGHHIHGDARSLDKKRRNLVAGERLDLPLMEVFPPPCMARSGWLPTRRVA